MNETNKRAYLWSDSPKTLITLYCIVNTTHEYNSTNMGYGSIALIEHDSSSPLPCPLSLSLIKLNIQMSTLLKRCCGWRCCRHSAA